MRTLAFLLLLFAVCVYASHPHATHDLVPAVPPPSGGGGHGSSPADAAGGSNYCKHIEQLVAQSKNSEGKGSYGTVHVVDVGGGRRLPVKQFPSATDYAHEEGVLRQLPTPPADIHIVVNDRTDKSQGFCPEQRMIVLSKYLSGGLLFPHENLRDSKPRLSVDQALPAMLQLAKAIQWLQQHGLVHTDIRGDNAMLDEHGAVYLIDLGNAQKAGVAYPAFTPPLFYSVYNSPPNLAGKDNENGAAKVTVADDVYRLGIVFTQLVLGMTPCGTASKWMCMLDREEKDWGDLTKGWATEAAAPFKQLPEPVQTLVLSMMKTDVAARPDIASVITSLQAALPQQQQQHTPVVHSTHRHRKPML